MTSRSRPALAALCVVATGLRLHAQTALPPFSTFFKANSSIQQIATDSAGNIFVAGQAPLNSPDVFVAKLDPATAKITWIVYIGGSSAETAAGLALDAAGSVYVTGTTTSNPGMPLPFATKLTTNGAIVYSSLFSNGQPEVPSAIAVDSSGEAIISGTNPPFVAKLDASGANVVFSNSMVGGSSIAVDSANNIYLAGSAPFSTPYPTTQGAFQTTVTRPTPVSCTLGPCANPSPIATDQYVTKLSADGSTLLFSTYLSGSWGSYNTGMAVDTAGDVWLTGLTIPIGYPYTGTPPGTQGSSSSLTYFTTELDPTGSKVIVSVPQGGASVALDPQGNVVLAGAFPSSSVAAPFQTESGMPDFPGGPPSPPTGKLPSECAAFSPTIGNEAYAMRLSSQDGSVLAIQILTGSDLQQVTATVDSHGDTYVAGSTGRPDVPLTPGIAFDPAVTERTISGVFLERLNLAQSPPASEIGCVTDAASAVLDGPVAPGQLITIYGNGLGPSQPAIGLQNGAASVPAGLGGVVVTFDGIPAPLLYVSSNQINVQVPFEVTQSLFTTMQTTMQLSFNGSVIGAQAFAVVRRNPSLFLNSGFAAVALNQDGTVNSSSNPAKVGSELTLFVNGIGVDAGNQVSGSLTGSNPTPLQEPATVIGINSLEVDSFSDMANAISGLGQITVRVPGLMTSEPGISSVQGLALTLIVDGAESQGYNVGIFLTQ